MIFSLSGQIVNSKLLDICPPALTPVYPFDTGATTCTMYSLDAGVVGGNTKPTVTSS